MKKAMLFALVIIGVTVSAQEIPSRIQEVFDTTNTETTYYKKGWYRYEVSNGEELIDLQRKLFESSESWCNAPQLWEGVVVAREFDYDDWVVILTVIENDDGFYDIAGDIMQKGVAVNQ